MTEKTTDLIISKLLDASSIEHYAESCPIEEINKAMVSKRGTGKKGFPEYLAISGDFVIVIEDKAKVEDQAKYLKDNETLLMDTSSVTKYAENGALHYALSIIRFFSNFGTFMYLSLRRPLSAKEKSMLFHP